MTRTILFISILIVLLIGAHRLYQRVMPGRDAYLTQFKEFETSRAIDTLYIGDSRTAGIKNSMLPARQFNFGYPGATLDEYRLKLEFAHRRKDFDRVVLQVDMKLLSKLKAQKNNLNKVSKVFSPQQFRTIYGLGPYELTEHWLRAQSRKGYNLARLLFDRFRRTISGIKKENSGYFINDRGDFIFADGHKQWSRYSADKRIRLANRSASKKFETKLVHKRMVKQLHRFVEYCRTQGIAITFLYPPLTTEFLNARSTYETTQVSQVLKSVNVSRRLRYTKIFTEQPGLFRNDDHLNRAGYRRLTRRITDDLERQESL